MDIQGTITGARSAMGIFSALPHGALTGIDRDAMVA
ncbi:MAG: hypothetical protein JWR26_4856 [Pedosphaera sp.]|nr:hypothetical protein [Pedosphaera sp.]